MRLLALFDLAIAQGASREMFAQLTEGLARTTRTGRPTVKSGAGLERIGELLATRRGFRTRGFPIELDALRTAELERPVEIAPVLEAEAQERVARVIALAREARLLGALAVVLLALERARDEAAAAVLGRLAAADVAEQRYLAAVERLRPVVGAPPAEAPVRRQLADTLAQGAAGHREIAAELPDGYRKPLHLSLFSALDAGPGRSARAAALRSLEEEWRTSLAPQPAVAPAASSSVHTPAFLGGLGSGARAVAVTVSLDRREGTASAGKVTRSQTFEYQQKYQEKVTVQVGEGIETTEYRRAHESCGDVNGADAKWIGPCARSRFDTRTVPVHADQVVEKVRDVSDSRTYSVHQRAVTGTVAGVAKVTCANGTVLSAPFVAERRRGRAYRYELPAPHLR